MFRVERRRGFFIETLHPLSWLERRGGGRGLRPNISDSLRKHICLRTNTAKARGEGEPSWRCLEAKWNAECVWDCLHCRTIFRVFWRTRAERGAPLFYPRPSIRFLRFLPFVASFVPDFSPTIIFSRQIEKRKKQKFLNYFSSNKKIGATFVG